LSREQRGSFFVIRRASTAANTKKGLVGAIGPIVPYWTMKRE
jgi:hypothetical protein